jgi:predicted SAM-dependent methyltransferase
MGRPATSKGIPAQTMNHQRRRSDMAEARQRQVLHVGCGARGSQRLNPVFHDQRKWKEVRLDIDADVEPDIVCSSTNMRRHVADGSVDAVWSSHNIEHLFDHEVPMALGEFRRVLRDDGFALIRCPDFEEVARAIVEDGLESVAYVAAAGPITPLDMVYGHRASIAEGNVFMAHRTAFTDRRLGHLLIDAGFDDVRTLKAPNFDLWALAFAPAADIGFWLDAFARTGLSFEE